MFGNIAGLIFLLVIGLIFISSAIKILREYERAVVFRLGRFTRVKGPGIIILIPFIDKKSDFIALMEDLSAFSAFKFTMNALYIGL